VFSLLILPVPNQTPTFALSIPTDVGLWERISCSGNFSALKSPLIAGIEYGSSNL
jgi:hypothetical protein